jgi:hypothetical protein
MTLEHSSLQLLDESEKREENGTLSSMSLNEAEKIQNWIESMIAKDEENASIIFYDPRDRALDTEEYQKSHKSSILKSVN